MRELRENTLLALGYNRPALEDIMKLQHPPNGHRLKQELAAALARAEAAEAALAAAQARVRELELQLAGWDSLKLMAIERQEDVPWQAFLIEFREPTEAERAYGKTLISLLPAPPIDPPAPA